MILCGELPPSYPSSALQASKKDSGKTTSEGTQSTTCGGVGLADSGGSARSSSPKAPIPTLRNLGGCQSYGPFFGSLLEGGTEYLGYPKRDHHFDRPPICRKEGQEHLRQATGHWQEAQPTPPPLSPALGPLTPKLQGFEGLGLCSIHSLEPSHPPPPPPPQLNATKRTAPNFAPNAPPPPTRIVIGSQIWALLVIGRMPWVPKALNTNHPDVPSPPRPCTWCPVRPPSGRISRMRATIRSQGIHPTTSSMQAHLFPTGTQKVTNECSKKKKERKLHYAADATTALAKNASGFKVSTRGCRECFCHPPPPGNSIARNFRLSAQGSGLGVPLPTFCNGREPTTNPEP